MSVTSGDTQGPSPSTRSLEAIASLTTHQRRLFDIVADHPTGLTVRQLAVLVASHENTVRGHLEALEKRGLLRASTRPSRGRGRPSKVYRTTAAAPHLPGEHLASIIRSLVGSLADDGGGAARALGRRWAEDLIAEGKFDSHTLTPLAEIEALFARMGCAPEVCAAGTIELGHCPFLEPGVELPPAVCALHQGALEMLTAAVARNRPALGITGVELHPYSGHGCTIRIRTTPGADDDAEAAAAPSL
ncbi:MAG: helix-turn-helix transcriptional regulator [Actinomycetota bacterium]